MTNDYDYVTDINVGKIESDDCISREAMLSLQAEYAENIDASIFWELRDRIRTLPSVTPTRPTSRWSRQTDTYHDYYECENCGMGVGLDDVRNFCPNCGAKMQEVEE